jgi:Tat protein secretion system quality control protein TatD with DNase activity
VFDAADSPWCEPRPTHASRQHVETLPAAVDKKKYDPKKHVKGRNEPGSGMQQVLEIVANVQQKVRNLQRTCVQGDGMTLMCRGRDRVLLYAGEA